MKTSKQGRKLLMEREGLVLKPYLDSVGVWTDGVGNTVGVIPNGPPISRAKADADLERNLARFEKAVNEAVKVPLKQHQFDAVISFAFNIGEMGVTNSWVVREINKGDMEAAAKAFDNWHKPADIISRRNGEREQFRGTAFEARIHEGVIA
jgi:lysozyme